MVKSLGVDVATRAGWAIVQADGGHESVLELCTSSDRPIETRPNRAAVICKCAKS